MEENMKDNNVVTEDALIAKTTGVMYAGSYLSIIANILNPYLSILGGTDTVKPTYYHLNTSENAVIDCLCTSHIFLGDASLSRSSASRP